MEMDLCSHTNRAYILYTQYMLCTLCYNINIFTEWLLCLRSSFRQRVQINNSSSGHDFPHHSHYTIHTYSFALYLCISRPVSPDHLALLGDSIADWAPRYTLPRSSLGMPPCHKMQSNIVLGVLQFSLGYISVWQE